MPLGPFTMFYGFGASPILEDGTLILPVDQDTDRVSARGRREAPARNAGASQRPHVISGYSTPTIWRPKIGGPAQILIPESFQLTAYSLADGKQLWWVRGLACEMKSVASIDDDTLYVNGWGFGQNQAGTQIPTVDFDRRARSDSTRTTTASSAAMRVDQAEHRAHGAHAAVPKQASMRSTAIATASSMRRTGRSSARCSAPRTA